ncbi:MAG: hypothetical protein N4A57_12570 [Anaeromicrobium sp.]|jgi:hypothetical protein|uniref:hypothetical protein n=1 Tax=Anaeromicrobium sp. TaxID=1929132 RepID=UPI0025D962C7|nr:hypothetical protein [Anaeromicrobium sp.]MCT4595083.1 hypothetical protein [Anaeromicrobium sp.]
MGEKIYYLVEVVIFATIGFNLIFKPDSELVQKVIKNQNIARLLGVVAIANAVINFKKLIM